jgi:tRNA (guanine37-N1)-methyltransferase
MPPFACTFVTLFPQSFPGVLGLSVIGAALERRLWTLETVDIRASGIGRHRTVDDTPAGGGAGMVLRADVIAAALDSVERDGRPLLFMSPRGAPLTQGRVRSLAAGPGLVILCGRFEGVDQRVIDARAIEEVSIGDFVLAGGEVAAMALAEACIRLLPGVAGNEASLAEESFEAGGLEYPHFTRPASWEGRPIPPVLLSGDHKKIAEWRRNQAKELTKARRPDLYAASGAEGPSAAASPLRDRKT